MFESGRDNNWSVEHFFGLWIVPYVYVLVSYCLEIGSLFDYVEGADKNGQDFYLDPAHNGNFSALGLTLSMSQKRISYFLI